MESFRLTGLFPLHDPTPLVLIISGLIEAWAFFRLRVLDITPIAHRLVIEHMPDLMLVVDEKERVVDLNPAASTLLNISPRHAIGLPICTIFPQWQSLRSGHSTANTSRCEIELDVKDEKRTYDLSISIIRSGKGYAAGRLLLLRDITAHKQVRNAYQQANVRLQKQLDHVEDLQQNWREQAMRDSLTGLFNRRYLEGALRHRLETARHDGQSVSVIIVDVDHFKQVNDTWGHAAGDQILKKISQILTSHANQDDIVCRFGGEEFLLVLPNVSSKVAFIRAEACREACASMSVFTGNDENAEIGCTISLGVASSLWNGTTVESLISAADEALYLAKTTGRNRTILATMSTGSPPRIRDARETRLLPGLDEARHTTGRLAVG